MSTPFPRRTALRSAATVVVGAATVGAVGAAGACTASDSGEEAGSASSTSTAAEKDARLRAHEVTARGAGHAGVVDPAGAPDEETVLASRALLEQATAVVVSSADPADLREGSAAATHLGIPLLVAGAGLADELDRLGARTVVRYSAAADRNSSAASGAATPSAAPTILGEREVLPGTAVGELPDLPGLPRTATPHGAVLLVRDERAVPASLQPMIRAVGADVVTATDADPRASVEVRTALRAGGAAVLAVGAGFGPVDRFTQRVRTAQVADELPGGGVLPFPGRRMVALYGHPESSALGMLGEQSARRAVARAKGLADEYAARTGSAVVPAFEIIASVASPSAQNDGSYSRRTPVDLLLPWLEAAEDAGVYVVLDLQPGRTDFLTQARQYEELFRRPWVGLALDPEWRLRPNQVHLKQIGSVGIDEVNRVGAWLAALVREHDLPPKVLTLHQFRQAMVRGRERLDTSLDEIQWLVHADGQGAQADKQATWRSLRRDLPKGVWLGWKNFQDEDAPMLTPGQTVAQVHPTPWFVSYQ